MLRPRVAASTDNALDPGLLLNAIPRALADESRCGKSAEFHDRPFGPASSHSRIQPKPKAAKTHPGLPSHCRTSSAKLEDVHRNRIGA